MTPAGQGISTLGTDIMALNRDSTRAQSALPPGRWWLVSALLTAIGLAQSAYLLGRGFALASSATPPSLDLCSALFARTCDDVVADERFWFLNVPVAGWGVVYFTLLGGLLLLGRVLKSTFGAEALLVGSLVTVAGLAVGVVLSVSAWMGHSPICPLCLSVHAVSLLLLLALQRASGQSIREQARLLRGAREWLRSNSQTPEPMRWKLVGFTCVALMAAMAYQWVYVETRLRRPGADRVPNRTDVIAAYRSSPQHGLPVTHDDPHLGSLAAPVRLVVFESLRCPGCRSFAETLPRLRNRFRDRLLIVYKHYPLSTLCNERLSRDMQPGSCEMAWAAQAAHRQAQFWPFQDALLAAGTDESDRAIAEAVARLKLDSARFDADRKSPDTKARVAADIALGNRLKIPGTPAVFLDGRLVGSARPEILEILIRYELDQHAAGSLHTAPTSSAWAGKGKRIWPVLHSG